MKKIIFSAVFILACFMSHGAQEDAMTKGKKIFDTLNSVTNTAMGLDAAEKAAGFFKAAISSSLTPPAQAYYYYCECINYKYDYFEVGDTKEKIKAFADTAAMVEKSGLAPKTSVEYNFCLALMYGKMGEFMDALSAAQSGVGDKVRAYAETAYALDKMYDKGFSMLMLGRLHYKAPNIPFIMSWPDKEKSKKYLEELLKLHPDSLVAAFFLADTLWDTGSKDTAVLYYKKVANSSPRGLAYWSDRKTIKNCKARMEELGIK